MDREKVIKEYEGYVNSYISLTTSDDYELEMHKAVLALLKDQQNVISGLKVINDGLFEAVTEQKQIVRCKDCIHRGDKHKCILAFVADKQDFPYFFYDNHGDWFCADGIAKDTDVLNK